MAWQDTDEPSREQTQDDLVAENGILRRLLAARVGQSFLYTDDGELQDNSTLPTIDFIRDRAEDIEIKLNERGRLRLQMLLASEEAEQANLRG
ncbi:hypothetical protein LUCX_209 [Xanthomonas phage vB_XciM_LucasX]|nr:hypothetical protein LUCX_209 [Xanthomonas phage vB_XciM_LucasX]